jgi:DNA-binding response OmpR family regulator
MAESGVNTMAILLVDDEPRLREALARSLSVRGHHVDQAATHEEAVNVATTRHYDLLLIDINLPDATGWDVLRDLKTTGKEIPAIVISALPPSAARIREFRPIGVLHKPFPIEALMRLVRPISDRHREQGLSAAG